MKAIDKASIPQMLEILAQKREVLAPGKKDDSVCYLPWQQGMELNWRVNSFIPPKDLFFPQMDLLYQYTLGGEESEIKALICSVPDRVIVGIRNCDLQSLALLDKVFLEGKYADSLYRERREKTLLIALSCIEPQPACFCTSLNIDPQGGAGADLVLIPLEQEKELGLAARTPEGEKILAELEPVIHESSLQPAPFRECTLQFSTEGLLEKMPHMFEHPLWGHIARRCLGCGICTYVCPTCHCFDIQGKNKGEEGLKYRCWDSCMFSDYTLMAGGHDPRPTRVERFRNRFMHKLWFHTERYGDFLCTGCGRCLTKCPVYLDISYVAGQIKEAVLHVR